MRESEKQGQQYSRCIDGPTIRQTVSHRLQLFLCAIK